MDFSVRELLYVLAAIQETVMLYPRQAAAPGPAYAHRPRSHPAAHVRVMQPRRLHPALRSYTPVAANQPSASANTIGDQEDWETRASSCIRGILIASRDVSIVSARWQNLAQWSGLRSLAEQMAGRLREPG